MKKTFKSSNFCNISYFYNGSVWDPSKVQRFKGHFLNELYVSLKYHPNYLSSYLLKFKEEVESIVNDKHDFTIQKYCSNVSRHFKANISATPGNSFNNRLGLAEWTVSCREYRYVHFLWDITGLNNMFLVFNKLFSCIGYYAAKKIITK